MVGDLVRKIIQRRLGIHEDQAASIEKMSNEELIRFRMKDPISATLKQDGLSLTGGHHRVNVVQNRVLGGLLTPETQIEVLLHD